MGRLKNDWDPRVSWAHPLAHPAIAWHLHCTFGVGTGEARNFEFSTLIDLLKSHLMEDKLPHKGRGQGPGPIFGNFGTSSIYLDQVKLDTSNFTNSCNVARTRWEEKLAPKVAGSGSLNPCQNCCDRSCTRYGDHQVGNLHVNCQHLVIVYCTHVHVSNFLY